MHALTRIATSPAAYGRVTPGYSVGVAGAVGIIVVDVQLLLFGILIEIALDGSERLSVFTRCRCTLHRLSSELQTCALDHPRESDARERC